MKMKLWELGNDVVAIRQKLADMRLKMPFKSDVLDIFETILELVNDIRIATYKDIRKSGPDKKFEIALRCSDEQFLEVCRKIEETQIPFIGKESDSPSS